MTFFSSFFSSLNSKLHFLEKKKLTKGFCRELKCIFLGTFIIKPDAPSNVLLMKIVSPVMVCLRRLIIFMRKTDRYSL